MHKKIQILTNLQILKCHLNCLFFQQVIALNQQIFNLFSLTLKLSGNQVCPLIKLYFLLQSSHALEEQDVSVGRYIVKWIREEYDGM